jgi:hypothetical protein
MHDLDSEKTRPVTTEMQIVLDALRLGGVQLMALWLRRNFFMEELPPGSQAFLSAALDTREELVEEWRKTQRVMEESGLTRAAEWLGTEGCQRLYQQTAEHRFRCMNNFEALKASNVISMHKLRRDRRCRSVDPGA